MKNIYALLMKRSSIPYKEVPIGWKQVGPKGTKQEVLNYVKEVWTDMRPKSLREQMDKAALNLIV